MNPDQMIYFVLVDFGRPLGTAWVERSIENMDRKTTIADIARGEWGRDVEVIKVLECNPVENICNDVTESILAEALPEIHEVPTAAERQAWAFDHSHDLRKHSEVV